MSRVPVKREVFRGKHYVVVRDRRGRFVERVRYSPKVGIRSYRKQFASRGTFKKDVSVERTVLSGDRTLETVIRSNSSKTVPKAPRAPSGQVQAVVEIYENGKLVVAGRSYKSDRPRAGMVEEARERAFSLYAYENGQGYDEDDGEALANRNNVTFRTGWVKYAKA